MVRNNGLSFYRRKKKISTAIVKEIFSYIVGICIAVFVAVVLVYFLGMSTHVVGVSMEPTLYNEQKILINRFGYVLATPKQGDVVVFLPNGNENAHYYVKRVVAVPGDKVWIKDGVLYVNGLASAWCTEKILEPGIAENEFTLESGEYFCIGDNPNNSEDSRSANIGPVSDVDIIGEAWFHFQSEAEGIGFIK